jgi:uracil phosphoribosyltransferase
MVLQLSTEYSLLCDYVSELRNTNVQHDRMRFRKNMHRIGQIAALEISKLLPFEDREVPTPLGVHQSKVLAKQPVLTTILRAGVPLFEGLLDYFDRADCGFVAAYRKHNADDSFSINQEYVTCPELTGRVLIIADPMLATGASLIEAIKELATFGTPSKIFVVCAIASTEGIEMVQKSIENIHIITADIDDELTAKGYIVPGLGDAGDLSYGSKMQF